MHLAIPGLSVDIKPDSHCLTFTCRGGRVLSTPRPPQFILAGKPAQIASLTSLPNGFQAELRGKQAKGSWRLQTKGDAIESVLEVHGVGANRPVEIDLPLPLTAAVDLPVSQLHGARVDTFCKQGRDKGVPLGGERCQLAAVDAGGAFLAFIGQADYTRWRPSPSVYARACVWRAGGWRDEEAVYLAIEVVDGSPVHITCHNDLEAVIDRYCDFLYTRLGQKTMAQDDTVPDWFDDVRVMVPFEMHRSDGEILNTFDHVVQFCDDLKQLGVRGGVVVRMVGFQGPFDSRYPYFDPDPELGGPEGFRRLADAVHAGGNFLMPHMNICGMDPFLENFEELEHLAMPYDRCDESTVSGQVGPYAGWPSIYPATGTGFDSRELAIEPVEVGDSHLVFETCEIPEEMEAYLSLPGLRPTGAGPIAGQVGMRKTRWWPGPRAGGHRVRFRFRFRFAGGVNRVRLEFPGPIPSLDGATYRISGSIGGDWAWSHPIARAYINDPEWIEITRDNLVRVCQEYDIDMPYIDWVNIYRQEERPIFDMIRESLPGRVFGCEYSAELGYNMFRTTGVGSKCTPTDEEAGHRVTDFARRIHRRYTRFHTPGYCFVPYGGPSFFFGKLCAAEGEARAYAERFLSEVGELGVFPAVRLNYRDHGLDPKAAEIIAVACSG